MKKSKKGLGFALATLVLLGGGTLRFGIAPVEAARISDIRGTKHNLSAAADGSTYTRSDGTTGTVPGTGSIPGTQLIGRNIKASSETQVCVFCHTPHGATNVQAPLWNRAVAGTGYTQSYVMYDSSTLDAKQVQGTLNQPGGSSKLCLSCHDGTMAIGSVNVLNGQGSDTPGTKTIATSGGTTMPTGLGASTGFTRNLGTDLSNDHPISISYNAALASADGELRSPDGSLVGARSPGVKPKLPLEKTGAAAGLSAANDAQIQCVTCHDPHIMETQYAKVGQQKFLRLNRFQEKNPPSPSGFDSRTATDVSPNAGADGDIICLACHDKNNNAGAWAYSAHGNPDVGNEAYNDTAADRREFRRGIKVWQAACLNCHDTHTVYGAKRLLREGTNEGVNSPKPGGTDSAALEETCYQCHDGGGNGTLAATTEVPNVKNDFTDVGNKRMPITKGAQGLGSNTKEVHDISSTVSDLKSGTNYYLNCAGNAQCGKDFVESRGNLGVGDLKNRHVECTDCHNPHRVIRAQNGLPGALSAANTKDTHPRTGSGGGTHKHVNSTGYIHSNTISGVLRGAWGVEPTYSSASFHSLPSGYDVKRGDPGGNTSTLASATYVTREYQICMKCHSDYGYTDNNKHSSAGGGRPTLGYDGGTASSTNGLTMYTNVAKEFQSPASHASEPLDLGTDAGSSDANFNTNNHRSWHPVMAATGRDTSSRGMSAGNPWLPPWNNANAVGSQTMYCTDCHGSAVTSSKTVIPQGSNPWGPHGSANDFILKGVWGAGMGATGRDSGETANLLCFKCHDSANYTTRNDTGKKTGFYNSSRGNLHNYHVDKIGKLNCTWCHVAVPHGWKNKALLVNLNDVGEEAGFGAGTSKEVAISSNGTYYKKEPYYLYAKLKVASFAASGSWSDGNCGSRGKSGANQITSSGTSGTTTADAGSGASNSNTTGTGINWMKSTCSGPTN